MKQIDPHAFGRPAHIAVVERLLRSVIGRRIDPSPARLQHVDDATDHAPIVNTRLAARVSWQVRRDLRKLRVRQPELIPIHPRFLSETVHRTPPVMPTVLWVWTLARATGIAIVVDHRSARN